MNRTAIARSPILAVCAALALSAAASAGVTTITAWPASPEDDDRDGKAVLVTDLLKVEVRSKADRKNLAALTYVTRLHWDSSMLKLAPSGQHCNVSINGKQKSNDETPKNLPGGDGCLAFPIHSDRIADLDGDPATDTYLELYWDDAWTSDADPLDSDVLFPKHKWGEWLFHVRLQPVHQTDADGHVLPEYVLGGKTTTLKTSGAVFPYTPEVGDPPKISVRTGKLEVSMPKISPYVKLEQPKDFGLKASGDHKILGAVFQGGIDLGAGLYPKGDKYPVCQLALRWFWNSKAMMEPPAKPGSRCTPTADTGYGLDAPQVKKDSRDLDRDPRTDRYCETAVTGDKANADLWQGGRFASLRFVTGTGFETAEVKAQIVYDDMCEQDGIEHRTYTLTAPETIFVRPPAAGWDLYATSPPDKDIEACVHEPCVTVNVEDVQWRFSSSHYYSDPEYVELYFFFNSHKLDATFKDAPSAGPNWTARKSVGGDDGTVDADGVPTDHDPFTDKYFRVELKRKRDRCSSSDCNISMEQLLESMPFRITPGFEFGKTQIHLVGVARTTDTQKPRGYAVLAAPEHPALTIHGPHDEPYVYPTSSATDYVTMVGPKDVQKHPHGPWFLGFTDQSNELGFQQVLAVSGMLAADGKTPRTDAEIKAARKLTFEGLIQADILRESGASANYKKLACGKFSLDVGSRDLVIDQIEGSSHCPDENRVTSYLSFGNNTAGVGVGRIELLRGPPAGLKVGGSFWAGKDKTILIAHRDDLVTIDARNTELGIGKELKFKPPQNTSLEVGLMGFKLPGSEMKATYDLGEDKLTLTGKVMFQVWLPSGPTIELDFSEPFGSSVVEGTCKTLFDAAKVEVDAAPGIVFHDGSVEAVGRVGVSSGDAKIKDLQLKSLNFLFDTIDNYYMGCADINLPVGKKKEGGDAKTLDLLAGVGFDDGSLDSLLIGVENANIEMGDTGLYFQDLDLVATELDDADAIKFQGRARFTLGEDITISLPSFLGGNKSGALGTYIATGEFTRTGLEMKGTSYMLGEMIKENEAGIGIKWGGDDNYIWVELDESFADGAFTLNQQAKIQWSPHWYFHIDGGASVNVPNHVPFIGGKGLAGGSAWVSWGEGNDGSLGFYGEIGFWKIKKTVGLSTDWSGHWHMVQNNVDPGYVLAADSETATVAFPLQADNPAMIGARWQNLAGLEFWWTLTDPNGKKYNGDMASVDNKGLVQWHSEQQSCNDQAEVCIEAIQNAPTELLLIIPEPLAGNWRLSIEKLGDLGDVKPDLCSFEIATGETAGTLDQGVCFAAFQSQDAKLKPVHGEVASRSAGAPASATASAARR